VFVLAFFQGNPPDLFFVPTIGSNFDSSNQHSSNCSLCVDNPRGLCLTPGNTQVIGISNYQEKPEMMRPKPAAGLLIGYASGQHQEHSTRFWSHLAGLGQRTHLFIRVRSIVTSDSAWVYNLWNLSMTRHPHPLQTIARH